jgi:hypothetical protein
MTRSRPLGATLTFAPVDIRRTLEPLSPEALGAQPLLDAILATGASPGEALGLVALGHGRDAALPLLVRALLNPLGRWQAPVLAIRLLEEVAAVDPGLALLGFHAWGRNRKIMDGINLAGQTWLTSLPEGLHAWHHLGLVDTPLEALPPGLKVRRNLILTGTRITALPEGLEVGEDLDADGLNLVRVAADLKVGGNLDLRRTLVGSLPDHFQVGGSFWLTETSLRLLPDDLQVGKSLWLGETPLQRLPNGLRVGDNLGLEGCRSWDGRIPEDAVIGGRVFTDRHGEGLLLADWRLLHPVGERPAVGGVAP